MSKEKNILLTFSCYIFTGLLICFLGITNVFATNSSAWFVGMDLEQPSVAYTYLCDGQNSCTADIGNITTSSRYFMYQGNSSTNLKSQLFSTGPITFEAYDYGFSYGFALNNALSANNLYSIMIPVCSDNSDYIRKINNHPGIWGGYPDTTGAIATLYYDNNSYLTVTPTNDSYSSWDFGSCRKLYYIFSIPRNSNSISIQLTSNGSHSNNYFTWFGYQIESLGSTTGLTSTQVQTIVNNAVSDLATTNDISTMQAEITSEINSMKEQQEITNEKLDETNQNLNDIEDAITDDSPTDMSGLGDSAGWLPAGPVDSILTLPLTMLNSLVSNLSNNSCQTISVELPFVKENITLPCVRSLYDKMGVTGTLFTTAGLIASAFILFNYLLALYKWVDDTLTMRENTMPGYFDDNWGGGA